ncbi:hypothetical protein BGLCM_1486 [Bifidobacterium gallicum DSM 20093 = LMG 11596]|uniref:Uncharacterized protein n=1 Tax=Bifidobacterium gallicum DSM 20093 = LMG 11596 TaxID=561180 RepID=A0A087AEP2_9BIFI|nr:hypothetical protein BGLCM_1486 [Bifidobacterium gallicum DSM 20093 = LMG 11596]
MRFPPFGWCVALFLRKTLRCIWEGVFPAAK